MTTAVEIRVTDLIAFRWGMHKGDIAFVTDVSEQEKGLVNAIFLDGSKATLVRAEFELANDEEKVRYAKLLALRISPHKMINLLRVTSGVTYSVTTKLGKYFVAVCTEVDDSSENVYTFSLKGKILTVSEDDISGITDATAFLQ